MLFFFLNKDDLFFTFKIRHFQLSLYFILFTQCAPFFEEAVLRS